MMQRSFVASVILPAVIVVAGFAVVITLSSYIESVRPQMPAGYEDSDLAMQGSRLKGYAFGTEGLIADWYYMRALQYIGDKMLKNPEMDIDLGDLRPLNPRLLYPYLQNATDLDPHFIEAFSYGAVVMPAIDSQQAIDLAKKGVAHNPNSWRLYQHLAYIYWKLRRYQEASETYQKGSEVEGAAPFMQLMAASMKTEGGSRETARAIYRQMLDNSDDDQVRITARRRLQELDSLDEREAIDATLGFLSARNGHCADSLDDILPTLKHVKLPGLKEFHVNGANHLVDPTGALYLLDRENCRVKLDFEGTELPVK